jgi:hypothetical protein
MRMCPLLFPPTPLMANSRSPCSVGLAALENTAATPTMADPTSLAEARRRQLRREKRQPPDAFSNYITRRTGQVSQALRGSTAEWERGEKAEGGGEVLRQHIAHPRGHLPVGAGHPADQQRQQ